MNRASNKRNGIRTAAAGLAAVLLCLAAAGCGSKRLPPVQTDGSASSKTTVRKTLVPGNDFAVPADPDPLPAEKSLDLPEPTARNKAGRVAPSAPPGLRATPENVTLGLEAASLARQQLGKQYQWGASGPDRFDCSGLVQYVYGNLGVPLPRVSRQQARAGQGVGRSELQPGDLVFFATGGGAVNHVGIYLGDGKFVHAPKRYEPVRTDSLKDRYWRQRYKGGRRLP